MNIELLIGTNEGKSAFMPAVEKAEWQTEISGSPGRLVCNILSDKQIDISEGAAVRFNADGKNVFLGYVFSIEEDLNNSIHLVCYDQIRYLLNRDTYIFEGRTASQIIRLIAEDFALMTGDIQDSGYVIPYRIEENSTLLDMIENALELTYHNCGKRFVLYDDFGRLCLKNITSMYEGGQCLLIGEDSCSELTVSSSVDKNSYNKVKLFYNNKKNGRRDIYTADDKSNIEKWGVLQYTGTLKEGENGQVKAEELLKLYDRKNVKAAVKGVFGDIGFRAGCVGALSLDKDSCYMLAERVVHRFSGEGHFMDLVLTGGF